MITSTSLNHIVFIQNWERCIMINPSLYLDDQSITLAFLWNSSSMSWPSFFITDNWYSSCFLRSLSFSRAVEKART